MNINIKKSWDRSEFSIYLINKKMLSPKVASDIASRCLRVEKSLEIDLKMATRTKQELESNRAINDNILYFDD